MVNLSYGSGLGAEKHSCESLNSKPGVAMASTNDISSAGRYDREEIPSAHQIPIGRVARDGLDGASLVAGLDRLQPRLGDHDWNGSSVNSRGGSELIETPSLRYHLHKEIVRRRRCATPSNLLPVHTRYYLLFNESIGLPSCALQ